MSAWLPVGSWRRFAAAVVLVPVALLASLGVFGLHEAPVREVGPAVVEPVRPSVALIEWERQGPVFPAWRGGAEEAP